MKTLLITIAVIIILVVLVSLYFDGRTPKPAARPRFAPRQIVAVDRGDSMFVARILSVSSTHVQVQSRHGRIGAYPIESIREATGQQRESFLQNRMP